ncbi:DNA recombination protein RmuC [Pedobacter yulinensis]|uniref:DNA recombination protein RmuC n=1 Tax=Pedobacter yulinensis TaxID=2126353 RepID=A0A2T3HRJ1_9SPHI|nr:DNA recombination protein RmuC [Pedobacter yulinensis]PST85058.1 DNA recombination protein RmuC [Pedobacter yulinensis]
MESYLVIVLVAILIFLVFMLWRKPAPAAFPVQELIDRQAQEHQHNYTAWNREKEELKNQLVQAHQELLVERSRAIRAESELRAQQDKLIDQAKYTQEVKAQLKTEFEVIANNILDDKSTRFAIQSKDNLERILQPLKENIRSFEEKVDRVYKAESDERNVLKGVIGQLMEQSKQIQEDAANLTKALKGDNKKQGNWGEVILERILESSGLVRDREYRVQASFSQENGGRLQPDVIIDLPGEKHLVIDSKVSLLAYEQAVSAETDELRESFTRQHLLSVRTHIQQLAAKSYQNLYQIDTPDFVLLFIPIESSFGLAVSQDAGLFNFAWERRVVIVSPSTLLATLRTIASIWRQERQTRNVLEIARLGGALYDKFTGFVNDMEAVGKYLKQSQDAHEKAMNKLCTGTGNLSATAEKIRKLGAKTSKQLDAKYLGTQED